MTRSRFSRIIAVLALVTIALMLALGQSDQVYGGDGGGGGGGGDEPPIVDVHFGW